jgi:hypothetical protein
MNVKGFDRRFIVGAVLGIACTGAHAQSALPMPDLTVGIAGSVYTIARQPDGSMVVGGEFSMVDGVPRRNLARLRPDGSLDPSWAPSVDAIVEVVAVDSTGRTYIGGSFESVDGQPRNHVARITRSGTLDAAWDPGHGLDPIGENHVRLAIGAHDVVFLSTAIDSAQLGHRDIVRILNDATGTIDSAWHPLYGGGKIAVDNASGILYAQGSDEPSRLPVEKISQSGRGDPVVDWRPALDQVPELLAVAPDGTLYVSAADDEGFFADTPSACDLARIAPNAHGAIDRSWNPPCRQQATSFAFDGEAMYMGMKAWISDRPGVLKLSGNGDPIVWTVHGDRVNAMAIGKDGSVYAGGQFLWDPDRPSDLSGRLSIARFRGADGTPLDVADAALPGTVNAIAHQSDGALIVGGRFDVAGTFARTNIVRVTADGRIDPTWKPVPALAYVDAIAIDEHDDVYVAGQTTEIVYQGADDSRAFKLAGAGSGNIDPDWSLSFGGKINALAMDGRGGLYVGGSPGGFMYLDETTNLIRVSLHDAAIDPITYPRSAPVTAILVDAGEDAIYIASGDEYTGGAAISKLSNVSGSMQHGWSRALPSGAHVALPSGPPMLLPSVPRALARSRDGSLYVAGAFPGGAAGTLNDVLKFDANGVLDTQWNAAAAFPDELFPKPNALVVDDNGDVYVGGTDLVPQGEWFASLAYVQKRSGARGFFYDGWAPAFDGLPMVNGSYVATSVNVMAFEADGTIDVGGYFTVAGGQARSGFARFAIAEPAAVPAHSSHVRPGPQPPQPAPSPGRQRPVR